MLPEWDTRPGTKVTDSNHKAQPQNDLRVGGRSVLGAVYSVTKNIGIQDEMGYIPRKKIKGVVFWKVSIG